MNVVREIQVCIATLQMKFWLDILDQSNSPILKLLLPSPMVSPNDYLHILAQCLQLRNVGNVLRIVWFQVASKLLFCYYLTVLEEM